MAANETERRQNEERREGSVTECVFEELSSRLGDRRGGEEEEEEVGENTVGEFSLSSLKLKLFLLSDSAPETEEKGDET